ncbi:hypothetical protein MOQ95_005611, partial [Salmonella enterica]|nr:hypothetical protein [Salmonella enterica]
RHIKVVAGTPQIDKGRTKDENATAAGSRRHGDFAVALCMANRAAYMDGFVLDDEACLAMPERGRTMEDAEDRGRFFMTPEEEDADSAYHEFERGCW